MQSHLTVVEGLCGLSAWEGLDEAGSLPCGVPRRQHWHVVLPSMAVPRWSLDPLDAFAGQSSPRPLMSVPEERRDFKAAGWPIFRSFPWSLNGPSC